MATVGFNMHKVQKGKVSSRAVFTALLAVQRRRSIIGAIAACAVCSPLAHFLHPSSRCPLAALCCFSYSGCDQSVGYGRSGEVPRHVGALLPRRRGDRVSGTTCHSAALDAVVADDPAACTSMRTVPGLSCPSLIRCDRYAVVSFPLQLRCGRQRSEAVPAGAEGDAVSSRSADSDGRASAGSAQQERSAIGSQPAGSRQGQEEGAHFCADWVAACGCESNSCAELGRSVHFRRPLCACVLI